MKHKLMSALALLVGLLCAGNASAESRVPYDFDFESDILTGSHDFSLATGWGHVVDTFFDEDTWETLYVDYSVMPHSGVGGSTALAVGNQVLQVSTDFATYTHDLYDLLVTPPLTGTATLQVKQILASGDVWFYRIVKDLDGSLTHGVEIETEKNLTPDGYTTVTLKGLRHQRVGIRVSNCLIDNFHADEADIALTPKLKIAQLDQSANGTYADADEAGNYAVRYKVTLTNNGDIDLAPGDENYSLSVCASDIDDTVYTAPITVPLAVGQTSDPIDINFQLNIGQYPGSHRYDVIENVSGTRAYGSTITPAPHDPVFTATLDNGADTVANADTVAFGTSSKAITRNFTLHNDGATDLVTTRFAATGDFTTDTSLPLTVPAHGARSVAVTMRADKPGRKAGTLQLQGNNVDYAVTLEGTVVDSTLWFVDFEDNRVPANMVAEKNWDTYDFPPHVGLRGNVYCAENYALNPPTKLISPLLEVHEGDSLTFDAAKRSDNSVMRIYYSADRNNWILLDSISDTAPDATRLWNNVAVANKTGFGTDYLFGHYALKNVPAGRWYIAFEAGYVYLDNLYGFKTVAVTHDVYVKKSTLPSIGRSNNVTQAKVTLHNASVNAEPQGSYTATLYLDGQAVATAPTPAIPAGGDADFVFSFAPHAVGTHTLYAAFRAADNAWTATTEPVSMEVSQETADHSVQVGHVGNPRFSSVPLDLNFSNSETETVYPSRMLNLKAGDQITGLLYRGANNSGSELTTHVSVWVDNATDTTFLLSAATDADAAGLTRVFDGDVTFPVVGSVDENADMLDIRLAQPVVYNGGHLRVVVRSTADTYKSVTFEADNSTRELCQSRYEDNSRLFPTTEFGDDCLPVVHLSIASEPTRIEGVVTDAATGAPLAGATVRLANGPVAYDATTGDDGRYTLTVYQNTKTYTLTVTRQGYNPYRRKTVDGSLPATINAPLEQARGLFVDQADIPQSGEVNAPFTVTATIADYAPTAIAASGYTAALMFGGNIVATAPTADVDTGGKTTLAFAFRPHEAGTFKAVVVLTGTRWQSTSDTVEVSVVPEQLARTVQAGDSTSLSAPSASTAPLTLYNYYSQSEVLYPASKLNIPAGSHLASLTFRGYTDGWQEGAFDTQVRVYMDNTTDEASAGTTAHDTATMTKVFDGPVTITKKAGSETSTIVLVSIPLQSDFVYDGTNLRIAFSASSATREYTRAHFVLDDGVPQGALARGADNAADLATKAYDAVSLPVAWVGYSHATTVSGRVTGPEGQGLGGATVTLTTADGIAYEATTDMSGYYILTVGHTGLAYTATIAATGYTTASTTLAVADADVTLDQVLQADATGIGSIVDAPQADSPAYNLAGQRVTPHYRGIVVTQGRKVLRR